MGLAVQICVGLPRLVWPVLLGWAWSLSEQRNLRRDFAMPDTHLPENTLFPVRPDFAATAPQALLVHRQPTHTGVGRGGGT